MEGPQPEVAAHRRPQSIKQGVEIGLQQLKEDIHSGFSGVFSLPTEGARQEGGLGFAKGMGFGLVGLVAKPITGIFGFLKHTTEGVSAGANLDPSAFTKQRRKPRMLHGVDRVLRPYNQSDALCKYILSVAERGQWEHALTLDIVYGQLAKLPLFQLALVCTDRHLLCLD